VYPNGFSDGKVEFQPTPSVGALHSVDFHAADLFSSAFALVCAQGQISEAARMCVNRTNPRICIERCEFRGENSCRQAWDVAVHLCNGLHTTINQVHIVGHTGKAMSLGCLWKECRRMHATNGRLGCIGKPFHRWECLESMPIPVPVQAMGNHELDICWQSILLGLTVAPGAGSRSWRWRHGFAGGYTLGWERLTS
jgi:hypothetical protein